MYLIISDSTLKKYLLIDLKICFVCFFLVIEAIIGIFTPNPMAVVSKIDITFWMKVWIHHELLDSNILFCIQEFLPIEWSESKVYPCYKL